MDMYKAKVSMIYVKQIPNGLLEIGELNEGQPATGLQKQ